jgi:hypothetical protein
MMVAVVERDLQMPAAIWLPFHRMGRWIPIVKAADDVNRLCLRSQTEEIDRRRYFLGGIAVTTARTVGIYGKHDFCSSVLALSRHGQRPGRGK